MPVHIRRREEVSHLPVEIVNEAKVYIGSHLVNRQPLKGLDPAEEDKYVPRFLAVNKNSPEYAAEVMNYWASFSILVPAAGVVLNNDKDESGEPVNVEDYVKYQWCLRNKMVANTEEEYRNDPRKKFYIYDPAKELVRKNTHVKQALRAQVELARLFKDEVRMQRVIRVLSPSDRPEYLSREELNVRIFELVQENPVAFLAVTEDKQLDIKAEIAEMVQAEIITKQGNTYIFIDQVIGDTLDQTVAFFQNKTNGQVITGMRAKLSEIRKQEKSNKGQSVEDTGVQSASTGATTLG